MSEPNTIPEFLGIIVGTIVVMSIVGVVITMAFEGATTSIKNKKHTIPRVTPSPETQQKIYDERLRLSEMIGRYTLPEKPNVMINRMKPILVEKMYNLAVERHRKSPLKGTPLEGMAILEIMNETSDIFKKELILKKREISMSDNDIKNLIDETYKIVYNKFFNT